MLCTTYCISITRYLATLHQVWCLYHSYVGKAIRFRILWHHNESFGWLFGHYFYFFKGVRPSLSGPTWCLYLPRMLGFDRCCINLSFLARWSPYSYWCDGTCIYWYLPLLSSTMGYPCDITWGHPITCIAFKSVMVQSYPQMQFFFMDQVHEQEFILLLTNVPSNVMWTRIHSYACPTTRA